MSEFRKDLEKAVDRAVFKTDDPEKIRRDFVAACDAWTKERSSLGGFLRDIRLLREMSTESCAQKVGVKRKLWQSWEANRETPTLEEIDRICKGMGFGEAKRASLLELRTRAPRHRLLMISRFQRPYLAARGVARIEANLEWQKWPKELREALSEWGRQNGVGSPEELLEFIHSLQDEEARLAWVDEVLGCND